MNTPSQSRAAQPSRSTPAAVLFTALVAAGLATPSTQAADYYWDTNGATANAGSAAGTWGTSALWSTSSAGTNASGTFITTTTNDDDLFFAAGTNATNFGTVTVSGTQSAHRLTFDDPVTFTLSGGTAINLGSATAGSGVFVTANSNETISTALVLNSAATALDFSNSGTGLLTLGTVTGAASTGTQTATIGSSSTGGITVSGVISDGAAGGKVALTVNNTGAGGTTLSGANTFTGGVTLNAGTLNINSAGVAGTSGPLGNGGTFTINGGTIDNTSGSAKTVANVNPIVLGGDFAFGTSAGTANNSLSLGGAVSMNGSRTLTTNGAGTLTLSGIVSDGSTASGLTLAGTGRLGLSGLNTYSGGTTVGSTSTLVIGTAATSTNTGTTVTSGATGTGNVTFADGASLSNTSAVGAFAWYAPTLILQGTLNLVGTNRQALSFNTLELTSGTKVINVNGKSGTVTGFASSGGDSTGTSQWEMASTTALTNRVQNGTLALETTAFTGSNYGLMRINNAMTFTNADLIIGNNVILTAGASSGALGSSATTSPNVTVNGILNLGAGVSGGRTTAVKSLAGTGSVLGSMASTPTTNTATLVLNGTSGSTTFSGVIGNGQGGAVSLSKTGASTQILTGTNTYTGTTTISAGTLQLGNGGTTGSLATTGSIVNNGNLTINRSNAVTQGTDFSSAAITGTGSFTQSGTGTTTLTAANTFSGLVTVNFGSTLATNATGTFGMGDISIATGGTLQLGNANSIADTANLKIDVGSSLLLGFTGTETVNSLSSVSGGFIAAGTYDATQLQAFFGDSSFAFSGTLNVLSSSASAIPEPSTYAALAGLGILGFAVYRRRKQS